MAIRAESQLSTIPREYFADPNRRRHPIIDADDVSRAVNARLAGPELVRAIGLAKGAGLGLPADWARPVYGDIPPIRPATDPKPGPKPSEAMAAEAKHPTMAAHEVPAGRQMTRRELDKALAQTERGRATLVNRGMPRAEIDSLGKIY